MSVTACSACGGNELVQRNAEHIGQRLVELPRSIGALKRDESIERAR
jgi:hypothetical protein